MKYRLSKSTFIRGLQCEKSLYLYKYHYKLKDPTSPSLQAVFNQGTNVLKSGKNKKEVKNDLLSMMAPPIDKSCSKNVPFNELCSY